MTKPSLPFSWPKELIGLRNAAAPLGIGVLIVSSALFRIHLRVQTTLIGYKIGHLKSTEVELLEKRSDLNMLLAKLTTRKHLQLMTEGNDPTDNIEYSVAAK